MVSQAIMGGNGIHSQDKLPFSDSFCAPHPCAFSLRISHSCSLLGSARILLADSGCQVTMGMWH